MTLFAVLCLLGAVLGACVVPLPYEVEQDAAPPNYTPVIVAATPPMPGPHVYDPQMLYTIDVKDQDIDQTIWVRVFRNYSASAALPPLSEATGQPTGKEIRTIELQTQTFCNGAPDGIDLLFDVVVADQPFSTDLSKAPVYQYVEPPGEKSIRTWALRCPTVTN